MTVAEVIEVLRTLPQDKPVRVRVIDEYFSFDLTTESISYDEESGFVEFEQS